MKLDFTEERDSNLIEVYKEIIQTYKGKAAFLSREEVMFKASYAPAKRFYVSERQAIRIVRRMMMGKGIYIKGEQKIAMYKEIERRVQSERSDNERLTDTIRRVLFQPAPRFYIKQETARIILYRKMKMKNGRG